MWSIVPPESVPYAALGSRGEHSMTIRQKLEVQSHTPQDTTPNHDTEIAQDSWEEYSNATTSICTIQEAEAKPGKCTQKVYRCVPWWAALQQSAARSPNFVPMCTYACYNGREAVKGIFEPQDYFDKVGSCLQSARWPCF
jgi:hypothetical protein